MLPRHLAALPLGFGLLVCAFSLTAQTTHTWQGTNTAAWADPANWSTGVTPDASGDTVAFTSTTSGSPLTVTLPGAPVSIGTIHLANTISASSVVFTSSGANSSLHLATGAGQPTISSATSLFFLNTPVTGTQGFVKTGPGTLSFRDNPHTLSYTGTIGLGGGKLVLGADRNLGDSENDLRVDAPTTLIADPQYPSIPLVLGSGRGLSHGNSSVTLALTNASATGTLALAGPISGSGPLRFDGVGTLALSGANTWSGALTYAPWPGQGGTGLNRESTLRLVGPAAVRAAGHNLVFDLGGSTVTSGSAHARIDLGGYARALNLSLTTGNNTFTNSSTLLEITNGELVSPLAGNSLNLSARGANTTTELRLPATSTLRHSDLQIGTSGPTAVGSTVGTRVRIGTQANFNLQQLRIGEGGSGRLDALAPGSTLRLGDGKGGAMSSIIVGNFYSNLAARAEAILDIADGVLDAQTNVLYVGVGAPAYTATARFRFGAGSLQAGNVTIGGGSPATSADVDYQIEQSAGDAQIQALFFTGGNATGKVSSRYTLLGGNLAVGQVTASGNYTGALRPRIEWRSGTIRNYPSRDASFRGSGDPATPVEIVLDGPGPKYFEVAAGRTLLLFPGCKLVGPSPEVVLTKSGAGSLSFGAQSTGFAGTLRLAAGELALGNSAQTLTLNAGAFIWDAGTVSATLSSLPQNSNRLALASSLTKTDAPSAARIFNLRNSTAYATHTLATYASTDLTLDDFTVTGVPANTAAEFVVGPTALTVELHFPAGFTKWRGIYFPSASNLGPAQDLADPDADGRPNLLEYALGSEPLASDSATPVVVARDPVADRLTLTFSRIADPGLTYTVRAANDPSGPWSGDGSETVFTSTGADNVAGTVTAPDAQPLSLHPRRFLRLFVTR